MSTLAEIETAIAALQPTELEQLGAFLNELRARQAEDARLEEVALRNGFHPLPRRTDEVVTIEMVQQLCDDESI